MWLAAESRFTDRQRLLTYRMYDGGGQLWESVAAGRLKPAREGAAHGPAGEEAAAQEGAFQRSLSAAIIQYDGGTRFGGQFTSAA
jgi:hypothetical protein